jgi:hypothetical protein
MMVETMFGLPADRPAARMREYLSVLTPEEQERTIQVLSQLTT